MKYAGLICLFVFLISCQFDSNNAEVINVVSFPSQRNLSGNGMCPSGILLSRPLECALIGDTLLVLDDDPAEGFVICLNTVDTSKYYSLFREGHGPGEWIGLPSFSKQVYNRPKEFFYAKYGFDIEVANIEDAVEKSYEPEEIFTLPPDNSTQEFYYLAEDLVIGTPSNAKGRLFLYNPLNDEIEYIPHIPEIPQGAKVIDIEHLYGNFGNVISVKPDNSKIVSALLYFPQIDVFDTSGKHLVSIQLQKKGMLEAGYTADNYTYYNDITTDDKYIYALYIGQRESYANDNFDKLKPEIHIFDWDGQPVTKYILNAPVLSFDVGENKIFGINPLGEDSDMIFRFDL